LLAINHPRRPKTIDNHAEAGGPECLLQGHTNGAIFSERMEDAFASRDVW
jgi:hypothetical protein